MVGNADDDLVESKPSFVDCSIELKLFKVEASVDAKPNIDEASLHFEASHIDSGVSQLG